MLKTTEHLSKPEARKLVLHSQRVLLKKQNGSALSATLSAIEHLGYIQIDTISVVQRAHHHTFWNRNPRYKTRHIDQLLTDKKIFEYWSHAAAYLPMCDYRYSLFRKRAIATGEEKHWFEPDRKLMDYVLKRIANEGPLMAKDFEKNDDNITGWSSNPIKRAFYNLFMHGELMIPYRKEFHKVYDLTEKVLPADIDTTPPSEKEYVRFLITNFLKANGLGQASEITYLLKNIKTGVTDNLKEMHSNGEIIQLSVGDYKYYALPDALALLNKPLSRNQLKILSPFDNLVIQRKRMQALFNFDYQIECYVPKEKRKYGYFALPVLWDGKLQARIDCKADRKTSLLHVNYIHLEPSLNKTEAFALALAKELIQFMQFNECESIRIHKCNPTRFKETIHTCLA